MPKNIGYPVTGPGYDPGLRRLPDRYEEPGLPDDPREGKVRRRDYKEIVKGEAKPGDAGGRRHVSKAWKPKGRQ